MSEHNHTAPAVPTVPTAPVEPPKPKKLKDLQPPETITRNGIDLTLSWFELLHGAKFEYQAPTVTATNLSDVSTWLGADTVAGILQSHLKKACQLIWKGSYTESPEGEPVFDIAKFVAQMVDLTVTGQKLSELRDSLDEVVAEQQQLITSLSDIEQGTEEFTAALVKLNSFKGRILVIKDMIDKKSRKGAEDEKTEASVPVK